MKTFLDCRWKAFTSSSGIVGKGAYLMVVGSILFFFFFFNKTYVVTPNQNGLIEAILIMCHNICFYGELAVIIQERSSNMHLS